MPQFIIGVDTGGTCTDAALIDQESGTILAIAKTPTTRYHLSKGISLVLSNLLEKSKIDPGQIKGISISTTLATNTVVENKGARVGLFVVGYVKHFKLPITAIIYLKGGHDIQGQEEQPLELEYLVETVTKLKPSVDAYAVCSAMSTINPTHELVTEKAIAIIDPKPVFCSHRSSDQVGMKERAATAALHAKLMPVMEDFIGNVSSSMKAFSLNCPLVIVTGNGSTIKPKDAVSQSGQTVASGPACTALFGANFSNQPSLVVDIGGTTTDIAMIEDCKPVLSKQGCTIDSWVTHIESVDMFTGGIGGDSLVRIAANSSISIGPSRVIPLAMDNGVRNPLEWLGCADKSKGIALIQTRKKETKHQDPLLNYLAENNTVTLHDLKREPGLSHIPIEQKLEQFGREQKIQETGFTPTDALHVLGLANFGNKQKAVIGAEKLAGTINMELEQFCREIIEKTEDKIVTLILNYVVNRTWGKALSAFLSTHQDHPILQTNFSLKIPLIGIGAAATFFLPAVAKKLSTIVSFPDHCEVGNAIGAARAFPDIKESAVGKDDAKK